MSPAPARFVTAAIALALGGCAVAPSPSTPPAGPIPTAAETPSAAVLFVAWERRGDTDHLLVIDRAGGVERQPLPAIPNGPLVAGPSGPLAFVSGPGGGPLLWIGDGAPDRPVWQAQRLALPEPADEPLAWVCLGRERPTRVAAQLSVRDALVAGVVARGRLSVFPPGRLAHRPGGCAWVDDAHFLIAVDAPGVAPLGHPFALVPADGSGERLLDGPGGDEPTTSAALLAYVAHESGADYRVGVGPLPSADGPIPDPTVILRADDERTLVRPVLSADGRRIAVAETDPSGQPARLLIYELGEEGARLLLAIDVSGASTAGPAWVADAD